MHPRNSLFLYLAWLAVTGGAVVAFASAGLPLPWAIPQNLHSCLLVVELLFVLLLWPFFARSAVAAATNESKEQLPLIVRRPVLGMLLQLLTLVCLAMPVNLLTARLSDRPAEPMMHGSCLILCAAFFVGVLHIVARRRGKQVDGWYLVVLFSLCAVFPVVYYFLLELAQVGPRWLLTASPFYAVLAPAERLFFCPAWILHSAVYIMAGTIVALVHKPSGA